MRRRVVELVAIVAVATTSPACKPPPPLPVSDREVTDADNDGYAVPLDCDDTRADVNPGKVERCDGIDNDCNRVVDDNAHDASTYLNDGDRDGFGDPSAALSACAPPFGYVPASNGIDCDDRSIDVYPGADEVVADGVDSSCDGREDCWRDDDGDSYGGSNVVSSTDTTCGNAPLEAAIDGDCNDADPGVHPGALETLGDRVDTDCDGKELCAPDDDHDGYGSAEATVVVAGTTCDGAGVADNQDDCNDADSTAYPGAPPWYLDGDGDGSGGAPVDACERPIDAVPSAGDCDDSDASIHPGAAELAGDAIDQDCNGLLSCYIDGDGDGYGSEAAGEVLAGSCDGVPGYSSAANDCDDTDEYKNPGEEVSTCEDDLLVVSTTCGDVLSTEPCEHGCDEHDTCITCESPYPEIIAPPPLEDLADHIGGPNDEFNGSCDVDGEAALQLRGRELWLVVEAYYRETESDGTLCRAYAEAHLLTVPDDCSVVSDLSVWTTTISYVDASHDPFLPVPSPIDGLVDTWIDTGDTAGADCGQDPGEDAGFYVTFNDLEVDVQCCGD